MDKYVFLYQ